MTIHSLFEFIHPRQQIADGVGKYIRQSGVIQAALNAFAEEVYCRASLFFTLVNVVGKTQALLVACVFFGLTHYLYGSPPGVLGFALTTFLLGKSMLETRSMGWAWFMHFVPDVFISFSYAMTWD